MPISIGPIVMSVAGDAYVDPANIATILWIGDTTAGDTVEVRERTSGALLWKGRAVGTDTYLGIGTDQGLPAPTGFRLAQISSGEVLVYLRETV